MTTMSSLQPIRPRYAWHSRSHRLEACGHECERMVTAMIATMRHEPFYESGRCNAPESACTRVGRRIRGRLRREQSAVAQASAH